MMEACLTLVRRTSWEVYTTAGAAVLSCPEGRNTRYFCTPMCAKLMLLPALLVLPFSFAGLAMAMWAGLGTPSLFLLYLAESLQDGELTWEQTLQ